MALTNQQYEKIIREYERTRDRNQHIMDERRRLIFRELPEYKELDSSTVSYAVKRAIMAMDGQDASSDEVHQALSAISDKKMKILTLAGYPADYLDNIYDCPDCRDTGYISGGGGSKVKCHCFKNRETELLYDQSNIRESISKENFSTLSYEYYSGEDLTRFEKTVEICKDFVQNFKYDYQNLFFYGTVGTGKSFLSGCVAYELLQKGCSVIYFSAANLFEHLGYLAFGSEHKDELYEFYEDLYNCDLLIIDDLGTEVTNSFVGSRLFSCLNERHLRRKATLISSNLNLEDLRNRYSDRVFSRITSNYSLCKLTGPDIRMSKKRNLNTSY